MEDIKTIELTFVNAYLLKAKENFILIDTGLSLHREKLENELSAAGCKSGMLKLVILTHGDLDHTGNSVMLREKYGCRIAMHTGDIPMVRDGAVIKRRSIVRKNRIISAIKKYFLKRLPFEKFSPDILLSDGQRLDEYGLDAVVVHVPGHTKGSIGILTGEGNFFAGDTFLNSKSPTAATLTENKEELTESLKKLKNMNIKTIWPGHGKHFEMELIADKL